MYRSGWLDELIRRFRPGENLSDLSRHLGHDRRDKVSKTNQGNRQLKPQEISGVASFLRISVDEFVKIMDDANTTKLNVPDSGTRTKSNISRLVISPPKTKMKNDSSAAGLKNLPAYGSAEGDQGGMIIDREIQWLTRPLRLDGVEEAYALRIAGDSMLPMYRAGDFVYVHPHLPLEGERGVVVLTRENEGIVKLFRRWTDEGIEVEELYPERRVLTIPKSDIETAHRVIGSIEP